MSRTAVHGLQVRLQPRESQGKEKRQRTAALQNLRPPVTLEATLAFWSAVSPLPLLLRPRRVTDDLGHTQSTPHRAALRFTLHVSRFTFYSPRMSLNRSQRANVPLTHHASRITFHALRFTV